jgi:hypothetical protein
MHLRAVVTIYYVTRRVYIEEHNAMDFGVVLIAKV